MTILYDNYLCNFNRNIVHLLVLLNKYDLSYLGGTNLP